MTVVRSVELTGLKPTIILQSLAPIKIYKKCGNSINTLIQV